MEKDLFYKKFKELTILFFLGFFAGCIYFHVLFRINGPLFLNEWSMILDALIGKPIKDMQNGLQSCFNGIIFLQILIFLLGFVRIGKVIIEGMTISSGFLIGATESLFFFSYNIKDLFLFWVKIVIIFLWQIIVLGNMVIAAESMSWIKQIASDKSKRWRQIQFKNYIMIFTITLLLQLVYIFLISYVNYKN